MTEFLTGDFNADGRTDILVKNNLMDSPNEITVYFSNGDGHFSITNFFHSKSELIKQRPILEINW